MELSLPLNWSYAGGSYYNSNLELNCTPLELNLTLFLELNFSLTLQGELKKLLLRVHFGGVSSTTLWEQLWSDFNSLKRVKITIFWELFSWTYLTPFRE